MPFEYLEDVAPADVAFRAWGDTPEEMFRSAAEATAQVMVRNLAQIHRQMSQPVSLEDDSLEMLLFQFLQEILFLKDAHNLILLPRQIRIMEEKSTFRLVGEFSGEPLTPARHDMGVDIKAVTFHRFRVRFLEKRWEATVVLDT